MYSTLLLKTLPVSEPEQLVELGCVNTNEPDTLGCNTSYPGFRMFRDENEVLSGLFAFAPAGVTRITYTATFPKPDPLVVWLCTTTDEQRDALNPINPEKIIPSGSIDPPPVLTTMVSSWPRKGA